MSEACMLSRAGDGDARLETRHTSRQQSTVPVGSRPGAALSLERSESCVCGATAPQWPMARTHRLSRHHHKPHVCA